MCCAHPRRFNNKVSEYLLFQRRYNFHHSSRYGMLMFASNPQTPAKSCATVAEFSEVLQTRYRAVRELRRTTPSPLSSIFRWAFQLPGEGPTYGTLYPSDFTSSAPKRLHYSLTYRHHLGNGLSVRRQLLKIVHGSPLQEKCTPYRNGQVMPQHSATNYITLHASACWLTGPFGSVCRCLHGSSRGSTCNATCLARQHSIY